MTFRTTARRSAPREHQARVPATQNAQTRRAAARSAEVRSAAPSPKRRHRGQSQRTHAYESLRWALILRRVPEGQRLRESDWSRRLGVNRTALREALAQLRSEGLVVAGEKTGYFVPRLDEEDLKEVLEVRAMVEGLAVERIVRLRLNRRERIESLRESCDDLEWILNRGYALEIVEADCLFHEKLVALGGNRRLTTLHRCLPQAEPAITGFDREESTAVGRDILRHHRLLVSAIKKGQTSEAKQILQEHLTGELSGDRGADGPACQDSH